MWKNEQEMFQKEAGEAIFFLEELEQISCIPRSTVNA